MQHSFAKTFATIALPLMAMASPATAFAGCQDDPMGFADSLENIEVDYSNLTHEERQELSGVGGYQASLEFVSLAAENTAQAVIDTVTSNYLGTEFIADGIPAYPSYEFAKDALICEMQNLMSDRIIYQDARRKHNAFEEGLFILMARTAITEDDVRARFEDIIDATENRTFRGADVSAENRMSALLRTMRDQHNEIIQNPEAIDGYIAFLTHEIESPSFDLNRTALTRFLGDLVVHSPDHIPAFIDIIDRNDGLFNSTYNRFFNQLENRDHDEQIFGMLVGKLDSDLMVIPKFALRELLELSDANPTFEEDALDIVEMAIHGTLDTHRLSVVQPEAVRIMTARLRIALRANDETQQRHYLEFWAETLNHSEAFPLDIGQSNRLLNGLDAAGHDTSEIIRAHIIDLARMLVAQGATARVNNLPELSENRVSLDLE